MAERRSAVRRIEARVLEAELRLFRVSSARDDGAFLDSLRSHYELDRPPRGPEARAAVIHMGLSMFDRREVATELARRVPKLGGHVATVDLMPGLGVCIAKTGGAAHWSVWGRPPQLAECVTDVEIAER